MKFDAITVNAEGISVDPLTTTATIALPVAADGGNPKYIYVAAKVDVCHVRLGDASVNATLNDLLIVPGDHIILASNQFSHIAFIKPVGAGTTRLNITPIEA